MELNIGITKHTTKDYQKGKDTKSTPTAPMKSILPLVMLIVLVAQTQFVNTQAQPQTCAPSLASLNVCAPFVVPGAATTPSPDCCGALQAVDHNCLCSTLRIASRIPAQCNLPPLNCAN